MNQTQTHKISVAPEDLSPLGAMMATAHPDSQEVLHRPKDGPHEDIPRAIEAVERMVMGEPFDTFSRGAGAVYLSARAAGTDTLEGLDKTRRLGAEGQALGSWGNTQAVPVKKAFGGFSFGTRAPKERSTPEVHQAKAPAVQEVFQPEGTREPEEGQGLGIEGAGTALGGSSNSDPVIGFLSPSSVRVPIPGLGELGAAPASAAPQGSRFSAEDAGRGRRSALVVTLPSGTKAKKQGRPRLVGVGGGQPTGPCVVPAVGVLGGIVWLVAGVLGLALGFGFIGGGVPRPTTPQEYLAWEAGQLAGELERRQALHEQRLALPASMRDLVALEQEERELAAVAEALGRVHGKR